MRLSTVARVAVAAARPAAARAPMRPPPPPFAARALRAAAAAPARASASGAHDAAPGPSDTASASASAAAPPASPPSDDDGYVVTNFYHLVDVPSPRAARKAHARFLEGRDVRGRIYVTPQGVNAQFTARAGDAAAYLAWVAAQPGFGGIAPNTEPSPGGHLFPKLRLKFKPGLISLAGGHAELPITDPAARATPLTPAQWEAMLMGGSNKKEEAEGGALGATNAAPIVLDVRNAYEWDAGHFAGAARPLEDEFADTPTDATAAAGASESPVPAHLAGVARDAPVMMYCTGGIRCDVYSAHLKRHGFTNLYTLEGGVHAYFRERGGAGWEGSLFVFDARLAVGPDGADALSAGAAAAPSSDDGESAPAPSSLPAAAPCVRCGGPAALPHLNCANIDCNALFLACSACAAATRGCCCAACTDAPRLLRPVKTRGQYGTWAEEVAGVDDDVAAARARLAVGRGEGRLARRRARAARLKARDAAAREERAARKAAARAVLAARGEEGEGKGTESERGAHAARLAALRARLARPEGAAAV